MKNNTALWVGGGFLAAIVLLFIFRDKWTKTVYVKEGSSTANAATDATANLTGWKFTKNTITYVADTTKPLTGKAEVLAFQKWVNNYTADSTQKVEEDGIWGNQTAAAAARVLGASGAAKPASLDSAFTAKNSTATTEMPKIGAVYQTAK